MHLALRSRTVPTHRRGSEIARCPPLALMTPHLQLPKYGVNLLSAHFFRTSIHFSKNCGKCSRSKITSIRRMSPLFIARLARAEIHTSSSASVRWAYSDRLYQTEINAFEHVLEGRRLSFMVVR